MKSAKAVEKYQYVAVFPNGKVYKEDAEAVIVEAESAEAAGNIFGDKHLGSGDWDVRRVGDEPRIAAIEDYADAHYALGIIDRKIDELQKRRAKVAGKAQLSRDIAYALPDDDSPAF